MSDRPLSPLALADALEQEFGRGYGGCGYSREERTALIHDAAAVLRRLAAVEQAARALMEAEYRLATTGYDHKSVGWLFIQGHVDAAREALRTALAAVAGTKE